MNLAQSEADRHLRVLYIDTDEVRTDEVREKAEDLGQICADAGVKMTLDIIPSSGRGPNAVFRDIRANVPLSPGTLLVCAARLKPGGSGYLAGTVSEKLLRDKSFAVIAIRVAQPGLLGAPQHFLVPVAGDREGFLMGVEILKRLTPEIWRVHLLRVMMIKHNLFRRLLPDQAEQLRAKGWESLAGLDRELADRVGMDVSTIDTNVVVSDDWAHEVIIAANRHKSHLILMEASWKSLDESLSYGSPVEVVLRDAPCDVAVYRGV